MVESTEQTEDPYMGKLEIMEDESMQLMLKSLYEAGQTDFEANQYILE